MTSNQFFVSLFLIATFAKFDPSIGRTGGILTPEVTSNYIAVSVNFLILGLTQPLQDLAQEVKNWNTHLHTQGYIFILFPVIMNGVVYVLQYTFIHPPLLNGFRVLSALPPPVSSAILLTDVVGGNVAAATLNSFLGCLVGIFLTPVFIVWLLGHHEINVPMSEIVELMFLTIVIPLTFGQLIKSYQFEWIERNNTLLVNISQVLVLYIYYTIFCEAFIRAHFTLEHNTPSVFMVAVSVIILYITIQVLLLLSSHYLLKHSPEDSVAMMFVASRKSLSIGLPIIEMIYENVSDMSCLSIPLLIYNPIQIVLGGITVHIFKQWLAERSEREVVRSQ